MDENESWYLEENLKKFGSSDSDPANEEFQESNKMHGMHMCLFNHTIMCIYIHTL